MSSVTPDRGTAISQINRTTAVRTSGADLSANHRLDPAGGEVVSPAGVASCVVSAIGRPFPEPRKFAAPWDRAEFNA
jgi:hypothetical protein